MTSRTRAKVRLVKCPKCAKILPEPDQVPLYTCGGCSTVLQAKYYRGDVRATELGALEQDDVQRNGIGHDHNGGEESSCSSQRSTFAAEQKSDLNAVADHDSVAANSAHCSPHSEESNFQDDEGKGESGNNTDQFEYRRSVVNNSTEQLEAITSRNEASLTRDTKSQKVALAKGGMDSEDDQPESSPEIASDNQKQVREMNSSIEAPVLNGSLDVENKEFLQSDSDRETVNDDKENFEGKHCHESDTNELLIVAKSVEENGTGIRQDEFVECLGDQLESVKLSDIPLSAKNTEGGYDNVTAETETILRSCASASISASSSATDLRTSAEMGSSCVSPEAQFQDNPVNITLEPADTHIQAGSSRKLVPRFLTKGSPAYDGSVSSFDGNDDHVPEQQEHSPEETLPSSRTHRSSGIQNQSKSASQILQDDKLKNTMVEEEGSLAENQIPGRNRVGPSRDRFPPRVPINRIPEMAYEMGSSSSYIHDDLPINRVHHHPYRIPEERRRFSKVAWRETEFRPMYYNYETSGEIYHRRRCHGYIDKRRAESWSQNGSLTRMPYSAELYSGRYTQHHRPNDLRWSSQWAAPMPSVCCHQGLCVGPSRVASWDPYDSESCPWAHEIDSVSDAHQRHVDDDIMRRMYLRERKKVGVKRHLRPLAGGAPFVACYSCFQVLQLPEDFLDSRSGRRTHRLRCGTCSRVLEFSLENESCLAPCTTNVSEDAVTSTASHSRANSSMTEEAKAPFREESKPMSRKSRDRERKAGPVSENAADSSVEDKMKASWQMPARSKSPLHRLMGYASPNQLLQGDEFEDM